MYGWMCLFFSFPDLVDDNCLSHRFPMGPLQLGALECFKGSAGSTAWFWMWYDVGPGWSVLAGKDPLL